MSPGKKMKRDDPDRPSKKMKDSSGKSRDVLASPGPPPGVKPAKVNKVSLILFFLNLIWNIFL